MARSLLALTVLLTISCLAVSEAAGARKLLQFGIASANRALALLRQADTQALTLSRDAGNVTTLDAVLYQANAGGYQTVENDLKTLENTLYQIDGNVQNATFGQPTGQLSSQTCSDFATAYYRFQTDYNQALNVIENHANVLLAPELGVKMSAAVTKVANALRAVTDVLAGACPNQANAFQQTEQTTEENEQVVEATYDGGAVSNEILNSNSGINTNTVSTAVSSVTVNYLP